MKTYYLLKDESTGDPWEILAFKGGFDKKQIQREIYWLSDEFYRLDEDGDGWVDGQYRGEWILNHLQDRIPFDVISWDNEDNLYF